MNNFTFAPDTGGIIEFYVFVDRSYSTESFSNKITEHVQNMIPSIKESRALRGIDIRLNLYSFNHNYELLIDSKSINDIDETDIANLIREPKGATDIGKVVSAAIDKGDEFYNYVKPLAEKAGKKIYHPIYFLFTDGRPDAGMGATPEQVVEVENNFVQACEKIHDGEKNKKRSFLIFSFQGTKSDVVYTENLETLYKMSSIPERVIYDSVSDKMEIKKFFEDTIPRHLIYITQQTVERLVEKWT